MTGAGSGIGRAVSLALAQEGADIALVTNAGVAVNKPFEQQTTDDIENLSSSAGLSGMKGQSSCATTKFAVRGLSESLYLEPVNSRVGITCVHPGAVATNILEAARLIVRAIRKNRFKLVFCVEPRLLNLMRRPTPVGTLKLLRLANRIAAG
jgi:NAD(P)-dependent dehydrogenase (short-subunit alcohol dehydrogenase family)